MSHLLKSKLIITLAFLFSLSIFLFFSNRLHEPLRNAFKPKERDILSIAEGGLSESLQNAQVLKINSPQGIWIEVYDKNSTGLLKLVDKILIENELDAYIQFQGRASNLALKDMDGVRGFEIIAPTYTRNLVPKLNVYRYDTTTKSLSSFIN
jgi:hypothetical protein